MKGEITIMLRLYKVKHYLKENSLIYLIITIIFTVGLIFGGIYVNLITSADFSESEEALHAYIKGMSVFRYNFNDELIVAGIFFGSFFLFGKWIISFFVFRYGFLIGYLCAFLIKSYDVKGVFPGCTYLFLNLTLIFPFIIILAQTGLNITSEIFCAVFKRHTLKSDFNRVIITYTVVFFISLIAVALLSRLKMNIFLKTF